MKLCPFCEKEIPDDAAFCSHCGHRQPTKRTTGRTNTRKRIKRHRALLFFIVSILIIVAMVYSIAVIQQVSAPFSNPTPTPTLRPTFTPYEYSTRNPNLVCIRQGCILIPTVFSTQTPAITYRPVTWIELEKFLEVDPTNINSKNKYNPDYYNCLDFSVKLVENAGRQDIKAWVVSVEFTDGSPGHAFVAFDTTDLGIVFIEPQLDIRTNDPADGQRLCLAWGDYECMGTIKSIEYDQCDHSHYCTKYNP